MSMANSRTPNAKFNQSSYADGTAYLAIENVRKEERSKLRAKLQQVAKKYGYRITNKIELKEIGGDD